MNSASKLPRPPAREGALDSTQDTHHILRERAFPSATNINEILCNLRESRSTGTLSIDIAQGGIGSIRFSERRKLTFDEK